MATNKAMLSRRPFFPSLKPAEFQDLRSGDEQEDHSTGSTHVDWLFCLPCTSRVKRPFSGRHTFEIKRKETRLLLDKSK